MSDEADKSRDELLDRLVQNARDVVFSDDDDDEVPLTQAEDASEPIDLAETKVPEVELLERIGAGGQGVVYRGRQSYIDRDVAVKVLSTDSGSGAFARRFQREAKTLASLRHPNIVTCYQAGITDGDHPYLVMEFVDGPNLHEWIRDRGRLDERSALLLCRDLARALEHAHEAGIIHRDVKPENVLLRVLGEAGDDGATFEPKLADLGLVRVATGRLADYAKTQLTPVGMVFGSPLTMAPEQYENPDAVDHRADIYGLGCVIYHAIAGEPAFQASTMAGSLKAKLGPDLPDLRRAVPEVRGEVAAFVRGLLAPSADDRPENHTAVARRCEELLGIAPAPASSARLWGVLAVLVVLGTLLFVDPWGIVRAPSVVVAATENVVEGQAVTLNASAADSNELEYRWTQIGGPAVELRDSDQSVAGFDAPRGLPAVLQFEVIASNGWREGVAQVEVRVGLDPSLAPLPVGERLPLVPNDPDGMLEGWRRSDVGTWEAASEFAGAIGLKKGDVTTLSRELPRGAWTLTGAIEPLDTWARGEMRPFRGEAGVRLEFSSGHNASIVLRALEDDGDRFTAGVRLNSEGELDHATKRPFREQPLDFEVSWNGEELKLIWTARGAATPDSVSVVPKEWPTPYPPSAVSLFVNDGRACFRKPVLVGK